MVVIVQNILCTWPFAHWNVTNIILFILSSNSCNFSWQACFMMSKLHAICRVHDDLPRPKQFHTFFTCQRQIPSLAFATVRVRRTYIHSSTRCTQHPSFPKGAQTGLAIWIRMRLFEASRKEPFRVTYNESRSRAISTTCRLSHQCELGKKRAWVSVLWDWTCSNGLRRQVKATSLTDLRSCQARQLIV